MKQQCLKPTLWKYSKWQKDKCLEVRQDIENMPWLSYRDWYWTKITATKEIMILQTYQVLLQNINYTY